MKQNNKNIFNFIAKDYGSRVVNETINYQKKYGFKMGIGTHATWNNEADAFKHTYMQAQLALWAGKHIAKGLGDFHEWQGNQSMGQSKNEYNMDLWNNEQGREIARELISEYGILITIPSKTTNDIIAEKVMQRMKAGKLITNPNDKRRYKQLLRNNAMGFASPVQNPAHIFTPDEIGKMTTDEFAQNEAEIMRQASLGLIQHQTPQVDYSGYTNPANGSNQIFSREDIGEMTSDEYSQNEQAIQAQLNSIGIPTNNELQSAVQNNGGLIYVRPYTRSDGTQVRGYYRAR